MEKDLQTRIEEAAKACASSRVYADPVFTNMKKAYIAGAEYGYKEAIEVAKGWIDENIKSTSDYEIEHHMHHIIHEFFKPYLLNSFEADMNKLWEEKK